MQMRTRRERGLFQTDESRVSAFLHADEGSERRGLFQADESRVKRFTTCKYEQGMWFPTCRLGQGEKGACFRQIRPG
jgi:hypothetical protein